MENEKVIEMLMKQNERLMQIIEAFASKEIIVNSTVNSYNGSSATAESKEEHKEKITTNNTSGSGGTSITNRR